CTPQQVQADIQTGINDSIHTGTTLLGDISSDGASWDVLAVSRLRVVVFREMIGLSAERASQSWSDADAWRKSHPPTPVCRPGFSPHAPYSVRAPLFLEAATAGVPVAIHLAETHAELELLNDRRGPLVAFLRDLGAWAPDGLARDLNQVLRQ